MAVEIPVIVDIDKAFKEAANEVPSSIKTVQNKINENVLEIPVQINRKGDLAEVFDFVGSSTRSMEELRSAIKSVSSELSRMKRKGASREDIDAYQQALLLLKAIRTQWVEEDKLVSKFGDGQLKNIQLTNEYEQALRTSATTIDQISAKISTFTAVVNSSDIGSVKFMEAAEALYQMSLRASEAQALVAKFGANTGSIDQLNAKLKEVELAWNSMSENDKFLDKQTGKLSYKAQEIYEEYKKVTRELNSEVNSLSEMNRKEQERIKKVKEYLERRKEEKRILDSNMKSIAALEAKIAILRQRLEASPVGSKAFNQLNQQLHQTQAELDGIRMRIEGADGELMKTDNTLGRLLKRSAYLFGLHTIGRFLQNVREVTAEFELQRVALGGIIHDTEEANMLFRQIKAAAIESPFQIKELVTYTKQLSAYRVETENLFNVTMKLADVSAGLGVSMDRLVLAYGQVRAASVLRGQELRQFTEAGIPLVDELAKKFAVLNGRLVTTSEVFDLISKRAVPFEMIAEIFDDMTEKGGVFYKMQEKQAETLAGQWSNLKDALSIMYDEMGNTDAVHGAMEKLINDAKYLMQNWRTIGTVLKGVAIQFALVKVASLFMPTLTKNTKLAEQATLALSRAQQLETLQQNNANVARGIAIKQLRAYSVEMNKAAVAQTLFGRGWHKFAASMLGGGWIGLAISLVTVLTSWLISARQEANRLAKELAKIGTEGELSINRSIANFKRLAEAAVTAADGSNEQNEALAELQRTYSDIIPSQNLQIDKLKELKGNYDSLTSAIEQKINMQIKEQKMNSVTDYYAGKIQKGKRSAKNLLAQYGLDKEQINSVLNEIQRLVDDGAINIGTTIAERTSIVQDVVKRLTGLTISLSSGFRDYQGIWHNVYETDKKTEKSVSSLIDIYLNLHDETQAIENDMTSAIGTMGVYAKKWEDLKKEIKGVTVSEKEFGNASTFTYKKEKIRKEVEVLAHAIEDAFKDTGIDITDAISPDGRIDFKAISEAASESKKWGLDTYIKKIQESYESIVPTDNMVGVVERKFKSLAEAVGLSMDDIQGYLFNGRKDIREYVKDLQGDLQEAQDKVKSYELQKEDSPFLVDQKELDRWTAIAEILEKVIEWLSDFKKKTNDHKPAYVQDPYIKLMQDRMRFMQDFKKGYDDLNKYLSKSSALDQQFKIMKERGLSLGINVSDQKMAAEELSLWYQKTIDDAFEKAKKHGATGTVESFLGQQITDTSNRGKALRDFQDLIRSLWDARTDFDTTQVKKDLEEAIKKITDEVKKSDEARNFFQNILDMSGDTDLARTLTVSVYGNVGEDFKERMQKQLDAAFESLDWGELPDGLWAELNNAIINQDYDTLLSHIDVFPEKWRDVLKKMADDDQKYYADMASDLMKSLKNSKTYSEKRVELARQTANRINQIELLKVDPVTKEELRKQTAKKEADDAAKLAYEAFKDTPMYVELFANLDRASTRMLRNMRDNLISMKDEWKNLDPTELKEMQSRLEETDRLLASKNPFKELVESIRAYQQLTRGMSRKDAEEASIKADEELRIEKQKLEVATKNYETISAQNDENSDAVKNARRAMEYQQTQTDAAERNAKEAQETANAYRDAAQWISNAAEGLEKWAGYVNDAIGDVGRLVSTFASDDFAETFNILSEGLTSTLGGAAKIGKGIAKGLAGIPDIISGVVDVVTGIALAIQGINLKKINAQIKEQQEKIDALERSYERLDKAMAKAFGSDYIYNYNKQLDALKAKIDAYNEQARLEESKGKKSDADKVKEYREAAEDAAEQIADMQGQLAEYFAGTDLTSAAKDFANSWIEAYKEFGSTTSAMKEKFQDLIQSMVEQSLGAKIMQTILQPLFDSIDAMAASGGELTSQEIAQIAQSAPEYIDQINNAMTNLMNQLAAAGYNVRQGVGQFTGISRDIANASEESITGLAAGINTQNFYMSLISQNVAAILAVMTGSAEVSGTAGAAAPEDPYKKQMLEFVGVLPEMHDDMHEVRRLLALVVRPTGTTSTHYVATRS